MVLLDLTDVGSWKRTRTRGGIRLDLTLDPTLDAEARAAIDAASRQLVATVETRGSVVPGS